MAVKTKNVSGRRRVRYDSYQDLINDAERLAASEVRPLGNWSLGQILGHLARTVEMSIDGVDFKAPWFVRVVVRLFYRQRSIRGPMTPGFRLPQYAEQVLVPGEISVQSALAELRRAITRLEHETDRAPHPVFGELSLDEWDSLHLRHAEMHMSFLVPESAPVAMEASL